MEAYRRRSTTIFRVAAASPIWGAVGETRGQVLLWEGELFPAFYHTESGGYTEELKRMLPRRIPMGAWRTANY